MPAGEETPRGRRALGKGRMEAFSDGVFSIAVGEPFDVGPLGIAGGLVARFGPRFDAQGVLAGSKDAARCIGYLTEYLTKQVADCRPGRA